MKNKIIPILVICLLVVSVSFPRRADAAFALVAHAAAGGTQNTVTTTGVDTTGANLLIVCVSFDTTSTQTISDSKSNTWTALTKTTSSSAGAVCYYSKNPTVGASHTFSNTGASNFSSIFMEAFSGADTSSPFDQENGATNSSTTLQPGSVTPSQNNEVIVTFLGFNTAGTPISIDGGFTQSDTAVDFSSGNHYGGAMAYLIQTSATAANPTWTRTNTQTNSARIATFKAAAATTAGKSIFTTKGSMVVKGGMIVK